MNTRTEDRRSIVVIGGGAAAMAAAIAAARAGSQVTIVEKEQRLGKKILVTGNGRCNLSNTSINRENGFSDYYNHGFASPTLSEYDYRGIEQFFHSLGLWLTSDERGWVYPRTKWANSVLDVLVKEIEHRGIECVLGNPVMKVTVVPPAFINPTVSLVSNAAFQAVTQHFPQAARGSYRLLLEGGQELVADTLIIATGNSKITQQLITQSFPRLPFAELSPVLAPIPTENEMLKGLDGVRCECKVTLFHGRQTVRSEYGEVLFRDYGVSGIVMFNMSRFTEPGDRLVLDFFPDHTPAELVEELKGRLTRADNGTSVIPQSGSSGSAASAQDFLTGLLHKQLALAALRAAQIKPTAPLEQEDISQLVKQLKVFSLEVSGAPREQQAQVKRGGLAIEGFDPQTLESLIYPRLFAAGEALDVDGPCGGYNLHWAWASGLVAGRQAATLPMTD